MTDTYVTQPAGLSGPSIRGWAKKINNVDVKEPFQIVSVPWRVDRSYRYSSAQWGDITVDNVTEWPFLIGWPTGTSAGTGIAVKHFTLGVSSDGNAGSSLLMHVARASSPSGGTVIASTNFGLKDSSTYANSSADLRRGAAATKGPVFSASVHRAVAADQYSPVNVVDRRYPREAWPEMIILRSGEYIGVKYELSGAAAQPNGRERLMIDIAWDEILL